MVGKKLLTSARVDADNSRPMTPSRDMFFAQLAVACTEVRRGFDRQTGMSQTRRQLLMILHEQGEVSHAAINRQLGIDGAAVTRLVKQLESDGLVARRLDPADNRFTLASLTPAADELVAELRAAHRSFQQRLLAGIDPGRQESVISVLETVLANLRALEADVQTTQSQKAGE
jgi:DNA-binding MarR family transcriptional regulator